MKRSGFTLVELLVAMTLLVITTATISGALSRYLRNWRQLARQVNVLQVKNLVGERLTTELRAGDPTVTFSYEAGKVQRRKNGSVAYLTSAGEVDRLLITRPEAGRAFVVLDDLAWEVTTP
ncbi:MAG: type II secretion system GspH family protein [Candidatus Margulisbacteria bacterium]|jgi:prepilin-type N-terminal cleavage/methylation domain-containing protein|nr:type II secretion system GspH family protein [Candidatus Margulisiibacteriota bacterium]